jgi:undecaprenyl pyrophosphate phosphatase UppP
MSHHLTYLEAVVTGLVQGVTELFPVSSLGHNVLIPALLGGSWASTLNVSNPNSPYLAFVVGLHVATAIAMIAYFWRDWLRIVRGFLSSLRTRSVSTADERLAWMIILATIPVGIVGALLQKDFVKVFAKPELAAAFLAINGVILLVSERMRRSRDDAGAARAAAVPVAAGGPVPAGGPGWTAGGPPQGYAQQQQPWQQQWQGPDPRSGQDDEWRYGQQGNGAYPANGQPSPNPYGQEQYRREQYGREQYGQEPWGGGQADQAPWDVRDPGGARDPRQQDRAQQGWTQQDQRQPAGRHGHASGHGAGHGAGHGGNHAAGHAPGGLGADKAATVDEAVAADARVSAMGFWQAILVGSFQILALLPGISRDGIVTVAGVSRGLTRQDAVRFSFLLSAPVILAAGALKAHDLTGPMSKGMHGPILVGSLVSGIGAYLSIRFLTKYFSEDKSLNPFGIYCLIAGLGSLAFLVLR